MKKRVAIVLLLAVMFTHHAWAQVPLIDAVKSGNLIEVQTLLDNGAEVSATDKGGSSPLVWAAAKGNSDIVQMLISHGANVNAHSGSSVRPLTNAAYNCHVGIAEMLIADGADVNKGALCYAALGGCAEVASILIAHGANVNASDNDSDTGESGGSLACAVMDGHADVAEVLLAHGADVNARDNSGITPLMDAAKFGHADVAELLIDHGADVNAKDKWGDTRLADADSSEMITLLQDAAAKQVQAVQAAAQAAQAEQAAEDNIKRILQSGKTPAIPEEARRHYVMGSTALKEASSPSDFDEAIRQFQQAVELAPWWADAYYNLGVALNARKRYADAINAWKLYLVAAPQAADARAVQDRIYAIQEKAKLGASQ